MNDTKFLELSKQTSKLIKLLSDYIAPYSDVVLNDVCRSDSVEYVSELRDGTPWAWQMLDSSAKIQTGLLTGNVNSLGNFDECIGVKNTTGNFISQYCVTTVSLANISQDVSKEISQVMNQDTSAFNGLKYMLLKGIKWGVCIPSSCTPNDLANDLTNHVKPLDGFEVKVGSYACSKYNEVDYNALDWVTIWILIILFLLVILSTGYEMSTEKLRQIRARRCLTPHSNRGPLNLPEVKESDEEEAGVSVLPETRNTEGVNLHSPPYSRPSSSLSFNKRFPIRINHDRKYTLAYMSNQSLQSKPENTTEDSVKESKNIPGYQREFEDTESKAFKKFKCDGNTLETGFESAHNRSMYSKFNDRHNSSEIDIDLDLEEITRDLEKCLADSMNEMKSPGHNFHHTANVHQKHVEIQEDYSMHPHNISAVDTASPKSSGDFTLDHSQRSPNWLCSFSLISNIKNVFQVDKRKSKLSSLNGLTFLSMLWLLFGHTVHIMDYLPSINHLSFKHHNREWYYMLVQNSPLAIDAFLVVTGVLLSYNFLRDVTMIKIDYYMHYPIGKIWKLFSCYLSVYYLNRFMRLTPALAVVVLIQSSLIRHFGSGPFWNTDTKLLMESCQEYWWSTLLYVQNYVNGDRMCLMHSWYLMVDMQLYIFSPFILLSLYWWPMIMNFLFMLSLLIVAIVTSFFVNYILELPAGHTNSNEWKWEEKMQYEYIVTHARFGPWIVGLFVGYLLFHLRQTHTRNPGQRMGAYPRWLWLLAAMGLFYSVFGALTFQSPNHENTIGKASIYNCLFRNVWAMSIGWVIFACETNNGGFIQALLTWKAFQPLGRLTYCIYLVHLPLMMVKALTTREPIIKTDLVTVSSVCSDIVLSTLIALVLVLSVEHPFIRLYEAIRCKWFYALKQWAPSDTHLKEYKEDKKFLFERIIPNPNYNYIYEDGLPQ